MCAACARAPAAPCRLFAAQWPVRRHERLGRSRTLASALAKSVGARGDSQAVGFLLGAGRHSLTPASHGVLASSSLPRAISSSRGFRRACRSMPRSAADDHWRRRRASFTPFEAIRSRSRRSDALRGAADSADSARLVASGANAREPAADHRASPRTVRCGRSSAPVVPIAKATRNLQKSCARRAAGNARRRRLPR